MENKIELLPCPFCGGPAQLQPRTTHECYAYVRYGNLSCNDQPYPTEEQAARAWNTRAEPIDAPNVEIAEAIASFNHVYDAIVDENICFKNSSEFREQMGEIFDCVQTLINAASRLPLTDKGEDHGK